MRGFSWFLSPVLKMSVHLFASDSAARIWEVSHDFQSTTLIASFFSMKEKVLGCDKVPQTGLQQIRACDLINPVTRPFLKKFIRQSYYLCELGKKSGGEVPDSPSHGSCLLCIQSCKFVTVDQASLKVPSVSLCNAFLIYFVVLSGVRCMWFQTSYVFCVIDRLFSITIILVLQQIHCCRTCLIAWTKSSSLIRVLSFFRCRQQWILAISIQTLWSPYRSCRPHFSVSFLSGLENKLLFSQAWILLNKIPK